KSIGKALPGNCAFAVTGKGLPLSLWNAKLRKHGSLVLHVHGKLGKEILFVLVHASEPIVVSHLFDPRHAQKTDTVGKRQGLNQRNLIDDYKRMGPGNFDP